MAQFRLGHLSDLHISELRDWLNPTELVTSGKYVAKALAAFKALLGESAVHALHPSTFSCDIAYELLRALSGKRYREMFDCLVVTGDLATTGWHEDMAAACGFFSGQLSEAWLPLGIAPNLLQELPCPIITLPGNHDRYDGFNHIPKSREFERHFGAGWDFDRDTTFRYVDATEKVQLTAIEKGERDILLIVLADFSLSSYFNDSGLFGWIGQGKVEKALVSQLVLSTRRAVAEYREEGKNVTPIWAVHFPPNFPNIESDLQLLDSDLLTAGAGYCGVELLLAGHTHSMKDYVVTASLPHPLFEVSGVPRSHAVRVLCAGSATGLGPNSTYSFASLDIETDAGSIVDLEYRKQIYEPRYATFIGE